MASEGVFAVVVAYGVQGQALEPLLLALRSQVQRTVLVVNPANQSAAPLRLPDTVADQVILLQQAHNIGLAAAQNVGITVAIEQGAQAVLFLDDDSVPQPNMVNALVSAWQTLSQQPSSSIGALGSVYVQPEGGSFKGFVTISWAGFGRTPCQSTQATMPADFLIASGTLVPTSVFKQVGLFDQDLFIDHVDTEWCLRAVHQGYKLYGVCGASMSHTLGATRQPVWWFGQRLVSHHSPVRYYYMFRNSMALYKRAYTPWAWRFWDAYRNLRLGVFMLLFSNQRLACLRMMGQGIWHGALGKLGPKP
jgi:rhamnosyltransferase